MFLKNCKEISKFIKKSNNVYIPNNYTVEFSSKINL